VSAQIIAALRRRADLLEDDAKVFRADHEVALGYAPTVGDAAVVNPGLLRFLASQFLALADEAEGRGALEPDKRAGDGQ
jgi:hypothetical protein